MSTAYDILDEFAADENWSIDVPMRTRDGEVLGAPESAAVALVFSDLAWTRVFAVTSGTLVEAGTATFRFVPTDEQRALLVPGTLYYFDVWSDTVAEGRLHQVNGTFRHRRANIES